MTGVFPLPRLLLGAGVLSALRDELAQLRVLRPLVLTDAGLVKAGVTRLVEAALPSQAVWHPYVNENPTCADADEAWAGYRAAQCDGVIALGGGSVIDTAKIVAALAGSGAATAMDLLGHPGRIGPDVAPLLVLPTTIGTGSESSPATGLHPDRNSRAIGTRSPFLVPRVALCDPALVMSLPPRLVAATGMDALAHCLEGFLASPAHPIVDAIALDGLTRAFNHIRAAMSPEAQDARAELMAASFAGGAAIHKGLGPAHAVALACGDQHLHHGVLVAMALPLAAGLAAQRVPQRALRVAQAMNLPDARAIEPALRELNAVLGLPANLRDAGYREGARDELVAAMLASPFNRSTPYRMDTDDYGRLAASLLP